MGDILTSPPAVWWLDYGDDQHEEFHRQTLDWLRGLGFDLERLAPRAVVMFYDEGYELHVDEVPRDAVKGYDRFDPLDLDSLIRLRRIIPVKKDSWPQRPVGVTV